MDAYARYEDLRGWLAAVDAMGELRQVKEADSYLEIGGISQLNAKRKKAPALIFDSIKGYPPGFRVLTGSLLSPSRVTLSLRLPLAQTNEEAVKLLLLSPA